ncbi:MAG: hypothetical protein AB7K67_14460 [Hyphomicrobiaceae bacterium]
MSSKDRQDSDTSPLTGLSQTYFRGFEAAMHAYEPLWRDWARWNVELVGLASRRGQAWLERPTRLLRCQSPQEAVAEQMHFVQTASRHYTETAHRLMAIWSHSDFVRGFNGALNSASQPADRDYISFREPDDAPDATSAARGKERRAA